MTGRFNGPVDIFSFSLPLVSKFSGFRSFWIHGPVVRQAHRAKFDQWNIREKKLGAVNVAGTESTRDRGNRGHAASRLMLTLFDGQKTLLNRNNALLVLGLINLYTNTCLCDCLLYTSPSPRD